MQRLLIFFLFPFCLFGQYDLFKLSEDKYSPITQNSDNTVFLDLNIDALTSLNNDKPCSIDLRIPFLDNKTLTLRLEYFEAFNPDFQ